MKILMFSIYDEKAKAYAPPFFYQHKGQATRTFKDLVSDPKTTVSRHPADYSLYHVGDFDDITAASTALKAPELICRATALVDSDGSQN